MHTNKTLEYSTIHIKHKWDFEKLSHQSLRHSVSVAKLLIKQLKSKILLNI